MPLDTVISCYGGRTLDGGVPPAEPEPLLTLGGVAAMAAYGTTLLGIVGSRDFLISPDEWHRLGLHPSRPACAMN